MSPFQKRLTLQETKAEGLKFQGSWNSCEKLVYLFNFCVVFLNRDRPSTLLVDPVFVFPEFLHYTRRGGDSVQLQVNWILSLPVFYVDRGECT